MHHHPPELVNSLSAPAQQVVTLCDLALETRRHIYMYLLPRSIHVLQMLVHPETEPRFEVVPRNALTLYSTLRSLCRRTRDDIDSIRPRIRWEPHGNPWQHPSLPRWALPCVLIIKSPVYPSAATYALEFYISNRLPNLSKIYLGVVDSGYSLKVNGPLCQRLCRILDQGKIHYNTWTKEHAALRQEINPFRPWDRHTRLLREREVTLVVHTYLARPEGRWCERCDTIDRAHFEFAFTVSDQIPDQALLCYSS
jgi:hypothetical protein